MATITNRSRYVVSVPRQIELRREFSYARLNDAKAYARELRHSGYTPKLEQLDDHVEVRIRQRGYPALNYTASSMTEADNLVKKIEEERSRGLFVDYTKAHQVTFLDILQRYIKEEGPRHKSWEKMERYKCNAFLEDAQGGQPQETKKVRMRQTFTGLEWMQKPFALIETTDIEDYIRERLEVVEPATVDREVDILSSIFNVAIKVWKYRVNENPMIGVRRPKYFNERDRRLKAWEESALIEAAREEDRRGSIQRQLELLMSDVRDAATGLPASRRKALIKEGLERLRPVAEQDYEHIPRVEAFMQFQLMTGARKGESLGLLWDNIDFEGRTAYLPETKNGRPRKLPLRTSLMELLGQLPQTGERVFDIGVDALKKAFARMCKRAGIKNLHIHDLRHEAISRVAETGAFSLVDLQAFSGHRDTRMLLRYSHLCTRKMAERLDDVFGEHANPKRSSVHHGRRRLKVGGDMTLAEVVADSSPDVCELLPHENSRPVGNNVIAFKPRNTRESRV